MYSIYIKRIIDFIVAVLGLLLLSPLLLVITFCLFFANNRKPFFFQTRPGLNEKLFNIVKFKTMTDAKDSNGNLLPDGERMTKIGNFVRKTSLDELPQLLNVLQGRMSMVGPRPDIVGYYDQLIGENRNILALKPGLTSEAAIKYANEEQVLAQQENPLLYNDTILFPDKVRMNLAYYYNHTFWGDIKIIWKTLVSLI